MKTGQRLFTKDGRKFGNAIIIETRFDAQHGLQARIETDFGNGGSWLSQNEIEEFWYTHIHGEELVENVDDWRNDRASARVKDDAMSEQSLMGALNSECWWERSVWPHPKFPQHMKDGVMPDVIWIRFHKVFRGGVIIEVTGWQSTDPNSDP